MEKEILIKENTFVISINGPNCTSREDLMNELVKALAITDSSEKNLNVLLDCLTDLSWILFNEIILIINGVSDLLGDESNEYRTSFFRVIDDVIEYWNEYKGADRKTFTVFYTKGLVIV